MNWFAPSMWYKNTNCLTSNWCYCQKPDDHVKANTLRTNNPLKWYRTQTLLQCIACQNCLQNSQRMLEDDERSDSKIMWLRNEQFSNKFYLNGVDCSLLRLEILLLNFSISNLFEIKSQSLGLFWEIWSCDTFMKRLATWG